MRGEMNRREFTNRAAAFSGCEYIMDYLKASAPLWKRERDAAGEWHWVDARGRDQERAQRWGAERYKHYRVYRMSLDGAPKKEQV